MYFLVHFLKKIEKIKKTKKHPKLNDSGCKLNTLFDVPWSGLSFNHQLLIARFSSSSAFFSYLVERLKAMPDKFYLIWPEPELVNVCFWYIPKRLRGLPHTKEWEEELGRVSIETVESFIIGFQRFSRSLQASRTSWRKCTIKRKDHLLANLVLPSSQFPNQKRPIFGLLWFLSFSKDSRLTGTIPKTRYRPTPKFQYPRTSYTGRPLFKTHTVPQSFWKG